MARRSSACIVGVGETPYVRRSGQSEAALAAEAVNKAVCDAGIEWDAIDGVIPASKQVSVEEAISDFGLRHVTFTGTVSLGGASAVSSLGLAAMALRYGRATNVVVYVARNGSSGAKIAARIGDMSNPLLRTELEQPYGWSVPAQFYAMICRRHMALFGTTKRQLAEVSLTMRSHAQLNPRAMMHGRPLAIDDYFKAPMVADPYQMFDCCLESDGAVAVVVTTEERARDLHGRPARIAAVTEGHPDSPDDLTNRPDWMDIGLSKAAPRAYEFAGITARDVDAAMIYDCFTFETIHQLEEAGFCSRGDGGAYVEEGNIKLGGRLPVNTHGGLLSEAHMLGLNHVVEAVRQLRGECGSRQVKDARWIAVTGWGNLGDGSFALLTNESG